MRDALGRLEQEGLITILPKKGLMVSGITEEDVHSMFEMRLLVEPYALRTYGADIPREQLEAYVDLMHNPDRIDDFCKSDDDFHELLMSTLPNKYLRSAYDRITGLNTRFRIMTGKVSMINREQTCEEHLMILEAAVRGDWDTAADALQQHLEQAFHVRAERCHPAAVDGPVPGRRKSTPLHPVRQMRSRLPAKTSHPRLAGSPADRTGRALICWHPVVKKARAVSTPDGQLWPFPFYNVLTTGG